MRMTRSMALVTVCATVLLAGACASSSKPTGAASGSTSPTSASAATSASSATTGAPATGTSASGSASGGEPTTAAPSKTGSSGGSGAAASACQGTNLKVTLVHGTDADPDPSKSDTSAVVMLTNTGKATCTMQGHPQVDLISTSGEDWPLENQSGDTPKLTLPPGTSALASLYLLSHTSGTGTQAFQVKSAKIVPPDTKTPTTVAWPWTWPLEDQSAATHPGTYIGAVNQTGTS